jgi:transcriptional regulator with XRE-family HTH domain
MAFENIQKKMAELGIEQKQLASTLAINDSGITRLFKGDRHLKSHEILKVCELLKVDANWLMGCEPVKTETPATEYMDDVALLEHIIKEVADFKAENPRIAGMNPRQEAKIITSLYVMCRADSGTETNLDKKSIGRDKIKALVYAVG